MKKRYIEKLGMELSPLGFGVMRLPMERDQFPKEVYELLDKAVSEGINYYDTAYLYQKGRSEKLVHEALVKRYDRSQFYIADKLPVWDCHNRDDMERIFQEQLERLGVEEVDFYLLHGLHKNSWESVYEAGVLDFLEEKRRNGQIHKVGFSFHDTLEILKQIESVYEWDFIQLQINYYDWEAIRAKENYEYLDRKGIPCMVMEPVGGGRLSVLPEKAEKILKRVHPDWSSSAWAMRYVAGLSDVAVILSGMNDEAQLTDNVLQFQEIQPLTEEEKETLKQVNAVIDSHQAVPCSGCRYCMDVCPKGVDIPQIFKRYNDSCLFENVAPFDGEYFTHVPEGRRGDACIQCNQCSKRCPQKIDIPKEISNIHKHAICRSLDMEEKELDNFLKEHAGEKCICFGAGLRGMRAKNFLHKVGVEVLYFCDNDSKKWGTFWEQVRIISPQEMKVLYESGEVCILVTSNYSKEIKKQLEDMNIHWG